MTNLIDYTYAPTASPSPLVCADGLLFSKKERYRRRSLKPIVDQSKCLIFTPDRNEKKRDFTGAFRPEAESFRNLHGIDKSQVYRIDIDNDRLGRASHVLSIVKKNKPQVIVFFCHGYVNGIQLGFRSPAYKRATKTDKANFHMLIDYLADHENASVVLYCCSTGDDPDGDPDTAPGSGDDSLADLIRDGLCERGARTNRVFAHVTSGHTTRNPHLKFYEGNYSPIGGVGASYVARPGTVAFRKLAASLKTDFRFRVPFMTIGRVHELLS